jgi:uncharacterized protein YehS (DUF1456 family)
MTTQPYIVKKYEDVLNRIYQTSQAQTLNGQSTSKRIREDGLPHSALIWTILRDLDLITTNTNNRVVKWLAAAPSTDTALLVVSELRKRNDKNIKDLAAKRGEKVNNPQLQISETEVETRTITINGATISAAKGTTMEIENGRLTIII